MVQFYDVASYHVVHSTKYPDAILSLALSPDATKLAVGLATGQLIVRRREARQARAGGDSQSRLPAVTEDFCSDFLLFFFVFVFLLHWSLGVQQVVSE